MSDQAKQTPLIELARNVPKNLHSEWASQFSEDGRATGHSRAPVGRYLHELSDKVESLEEENIALMEAGQLITGWREFDHPEWFCRRTAQLLADHWRESAPPMKVREE